MGSDEIQENSRSHVFYHGTRAEAAKRIVQEGFKAWRFDEDGERYASGGCLGIGIYITCNWRMALFFGNVLLEVTLKPGTRILDASKEPDPAVLSYLQREFGREILTRSPWKSLPWNKQLTQEELITLVRYHYRKTWVSPEGDSRRKRFGSWPKKRDKHSRLLERFRNILVRYGFHGYGHPEDDLGIVIFADDRVVLQHLVAVVPWKTWCEDYEELESYDSIEGFRRIFGKHESCAAGDWPAESMSGDDKKFF